MLTEFRSFWIVQTMAVWPCRGGGYCKISWWPNYVGRQSDANTQNLKLLISLDTTVAFGFCKCNCTEFLTGNDDPRIDLIYETVGNLVPPEEGRAISQPAPLSFWWNQLGLPINEAIYPLPGYQLCFTYWRFLFLRITLKKNLILIFQILCSFLMYYIMY